MQRPGSLPHTPPENTKTTQQPLLGPTSRTKRQQAPGSLGTAVRSPLSVCMPGTQGKSSCPGRTSRSSGVTLGPALCSGTQLQTRQAKPGTGLSL